MKAKTVKAKITIWFSILFIVLVGIVLILLFLIGKSVLKSNTKEQLQTLVEANALELEFLEDEDEMDLEEGDHYLPYKDGYLEIDDDFCGFLDGMYVSLYNGDTLLYGENPIGAGPGEVVFRQGKLREQMYQKEKYYIYDVSVKGEDLDGLWLRGITGESEGISLLARVIRFMALFLPALAAVAVIGGYLISRKALKPLDDICDQAGSINSGSDLTRRICIKNESAETNRLAENFNQMFDRLLDSFESEKQFTSDASHELRTPVAVILAECEYVLGEEDSEEWREALLVIRRQGTKMSEMIEELLTFTRIERGTIKLETERLNLSDLTEGVCREQTQIWKKDIALHRDFQENLYLNADRGLLERMITNLVANAFQYGKEPGNIWVRLYEEDAHVILSVQDDGIGIREEELEKIWNRFYRTDNARKGGDSTGLGLSMVRQIAKLYDAQIKVFSEIGKGSTFLIIF